MDFTEINSSGKRGELFGRIDRQNYRFRTAKTIKIKFGLHASFVELESAKNAVNEVMEDLLMRDQSGTFCMMTGYSNLLTTMAMVLTDLTLASADIADDVEERSHLRSGSRNHE
ncbi:hypothetical protein TNCV_2333471 [Trichonephila clavipes]|nr:hypothetical protein TNCV_2333471 [Trichonephila clavipes]